MTRRLATIAASRPSPRERKMRLGTYLEPLPAVCGAAEGADVAAAVGGNAVDAGTKTGGLGGVSWQLAAEASASADIKSEANRRSFISSLYARSTGSNHS